MNNRYGMRPNPYPYNYRRYSETVRRFGPWVECSFAEATVADSHGGKMAVLTDDMGHWATEGATEDATGYDCWVRYSDGE